MADMRFKEELEATPGVCLSGANSLCRIDFDLFLQFSPTTIRAFPLKKGKNYRVRKSSEYNDIVLVKRLRSSTNVVERLHCSNLTAFSVTRLQSPEKLASIVSSNLSYHLKVSQISEENGLCPLANLPKAAEKYIFNL